MNTTSQTLAIDESAEWAALETHASSVGNTLRELFDDDERASKYTFDVGDLKVDLSKHLLTDETVDLLVDLASRCQVAERFDQMLTGDRINSTEDRSVLHTALRRRSSDTLVVDGIDVMPQIHAVLDSMARLADRVRGGDWKGFTGKAIDTVVNIGIGGSDLGPAMAVRALEPYVAHHMSFEFVSNVDPVQMTQTLRRIDPETTLFLIASKTFTTAETMANARAARSWLTGAIGDDAAVANHFVALSTNAQAVEEFGIDTRNMFEFWDWVGGRYSMDSAIGLSLMIAIGPDAFDDLLGGFRTVDNYVHETPLRSNAVVLSALLGVWYRNFLNWSAHAVLPYAQLLDRFPAYLQQLDMESNGKRVRTDGSAVGYDTGPIVWGEPGTNGQHAFYQLLHQGTSPVPCDFIGFLNPPKGYDQFHDPNAPTQHDLLFANMVAQAEALAFGRTSDEVEATESNPDLISHRTFPGNRPSTTIVARDLTPAVLGQLVAFYEHRVFVQGVVWGVNSFDQWGVELGKVLAGTVVGELVDPGADIGHDCSTNALVTMYRAAVASRQPPGQD
ncbi:MAG: glucose-6-phosphate isomerase [Actinomycetia bacterium]|nr:glucose-6-phosphate isomerase [Actinomycetes bacterium]